MRFVHHRGILLKASADTILLSSSSFSTSPSHRSTKPTITSAEDKIFEPVPAAEAIRLCAQCRLDVGPPAGVLDERSGAASPQGAASAARQVNPCASNTVVPSNPVVPLNPCAFEPNVPLNLRVFEPVVPLNPSCL